MPHIDLPTLIYTLCLSLIFLNTSNAVKCKDEKNKDVDWYLVYKIPKLEKQGNPFDTGYAYAFMTSDHYEEWQLSTYLINKKDSIFGKTLKDVYRTKRSKYSFIFYSDQPPTGKSKGTPGHTKGVLVMDNKHGFWLTHSIPKFPSPVSGFAPNYKYPKSGRENGQTALCISFTTKTEAEKIVYQLLRKEPFIYDDYTEKMMKIIPSMKQLMDADWKKAEKSKHVIKSIAGEEFISFVKGEEIEEDLYSDILAPSLESDLMVETWRKGVGNPLDSKCQVKYQVINVKEVTISNQSWSYTEDHSKWAITDSSGGQKSLKYTCIGDINRMKSQFKRGGGIVCFNKTEVWNTFKESISNTEPCPRRVVTDTLLVNQTVTHLSSETTIKSGVGCVPPMKGVIITFASIISLIFNMIY